MDRHPFIEYMLYEDKSSFPFASSKGFIDLDNDFLIGLSGGFLMNQSYKFINTNKFSEVAREYEVRILDGWKGTEAYSGYREGTEGYKKFWIRETERRRKGMTISKGKLFKDGHTEELRISGDHYNYLNYGRIMRTPNPKERKELDKEGKFKIKLLQGFPRFWDGDYWNFKTDEFIANNNYHLCKAKARGKGYSFKRGSQGANTLNLNRDVTIVLASYLIDYLTDPGATTDMLKRNLDWYENNTYWKRGYLSEQLENIELGYKLKSEGNKKFGYRSKCMSVSLFNNESAAIGKRAVEIDFEEAGKIINLQEALNVTLSSTEVGSENIGTIRVYGTAGTKAANWTAFSNAFYQPMGNNMMPFENIYDNNSRHSTCGFFHPQMLNYEPYIDEYGNSLLETAYEKDLEDKEAKRKSLTLSDWLIYVGQRANSPSEAFTTGQENIFSSPELNDCIINLKSDKSLSYYRDGMVMMGDGGKTIFKTNETIRLEGHRPHPYVENFPIRKDDDPYGCVREFYPPFMRDGNIPDNLYYVVLDPVAKDKDMKELTIRHSLNSMYVMMYPNNVSNSSGDIMVASYCGRPGLMEDVSRIASLLCLRYNAKLLVEVDRGQTVADFRKWKLLHLLHRDPTSALEERITQNKNPNYGIVIGSTQRAEDGLLYLKDWLYTPVAKDAEEDKDLYNLHFVRDLPFLLELQQFNKTGNFDRISAMRVAMFQRMAYRVKRSKPSNITSHIPMLQQINLYGYSQQQNNFI